MGKTLVKSDGKVSSLKKIAQWRLDIKQQILSSFRPSHSSTKNVRDHS